MRTTRWGGRKAGGIADGGRGRQSTIRRRRRAGLDRRLSIGRSWKHRSPALLASRVSGTRQERADASVRLLLVGLVRRAQLGVSPELEDASADGDGLIRGAVECRRRDRQDASLFLELAKVVQLGQERVKRA
jgi:hypothetical protein